MKQIAEEAAMKAFPINHVEYELPNGVTLGTDTNVEFREAYRMGYQKALKVIRADVERRIEVYNRTIEKYSDKKKSMKAERDSWKWAECKSFLSFLDTLQDRPCQTCTNDKGCVTCEEGKLWEGKKQEPEIITLKGVKYKQVPEKTDDKVCKECDYFLDNGSCDLDDDCPCGYHFILERVEV